MVFTESAIPRIGRGATSDTYVCVQARMRPMAKPAKIFPPRNMAALFAANSTPTPAVEQSMVARKTKRRPKRSRSSPAVTDPAIVMTL